MQPTFGGVVVVVECKMFAAVQKVLEKCKSVEVLVESRELVGEHFWQELLVVVGHCF